MVALALALTTFLAANPAALEEHGCTTCHDSSNPERNEKALKVFDLDQPGWPRQLSERRVPSVRKRLEQKGATSAELAEVQAFLERARAQQEP
jgi:cytochrome c peroxidase